MVQQNTTTSRVASTAGNSSSNPPTGSSTDALLAAVAAVTVAAEAAVNAARVASTASELCSQACVAANDAGDLWTVAAPTPPPAPTAQIPIAPPPVTPAGFPAEEPPTPPPVRTFSDGTNTQIPPADPQEEYAPPRIRVPDLPLIVPSEPTNRPASSSRTRRRATVATGEAIPINVAPSADVPDWMRGPHKIPGTSRRRRRQNAYTDADATAFDVMYNLYHQQNREPEREDPRQLVGFLSFLIAAIVALAVLLVRV